MPSPKAAVSVAVHAAAAAVTWQQARAEVDISYPEGVGAARVEPRGVLPWAGLAQKVDVAGGADAQVDPQYVAIELPKVGISFVQIVHGIRAEFATGIYRFYDSVVASDELSFDIGQLLQDSVAVVEVFDAGMIKRFSDSVSVPDVFSALLILEKVVPPEFVPVVDAIAKLITLGRADSVTASDVLAVTFTKGFADSAAAVDLATVTLTKGAFADTVVVLDAPVKDIGKAAADSAIASDAISAFDFGRTFADSVATVEAIAKDITRSISDAAAVTDLIVISLTTVFADTVTPTELAVFSGVGGKPEWNERELNVGEFN